MKVRIKFSKKGPLKYIGHLDVMRYFQKAIRRSKIDAAYSGGYSPHMNMSFAEPLGIGVTSVAEYFDLELMYKDPLGEEAEYVSKEDAESRKKCPPSDYLLNSLNAVMAPDIEILSVVRIGPAKKENAMSNVAAASYGIKINTDSDIDNIDEKIKDYLSQDEIVEVKTSKSGSREVDIKPMIFSLQKSDNENYDITMLISSGSEANLRPDLLLDSFMRFIGKDYDPLEAEIERTEMFGMCDGKLVTLEELGTVIND